jgi:hypothetical protein
MNTDTEPSARTLEALARQQRELLERVAKLERELRELEARVVEDEIEAAEAVGTGT